MSTLHIEHITRPDGQALIYRLRGVLGESGYSYDFLEELRRQVHEGPPRIVLNLEHLEYATSSGVGVIAAAYTSARKAKKTLTLVAAPPVVRRVLEICGLLAVIPHYASEEDACQAT
jgi:anti-anti-sigma factor